MYYETCNNGNENEPRVTPKPAARFNCPSAPIVPEVSLIFDKPIARNISRDETCSSPLFDKHKSYAAWKELTFTTQTLKSQQPEISPFPSISPGHDVYDGQCKSIRAINESPINNSLKRNVTCSKEHQTWTKTTKDYQQSNALAQSDVNNRKIYFEQQQCINARNDEHELINDSRNCNGHQSLRSNDKSKDHNRCNDRIGLRKCNKTIDETIDKHYTSNHCMNEIQAIPHMFNSDHHLDINRYALPQFCPPHYSSHNASSNETVKNLLLLVNNQSEQIKVLQTQVDRLLKMQEESFKDKWKCTCSPRTSHEERSCRHACSVPNSPECHTSQNECLKKNLPQNAYNNEKVKENIDEKKWNAVLVDQQSRKAHSKQKVSIGVMTSFELTVQNSPLMLDSDDCKMYKKPQNEITNRTSNANVHDTNEALRRNKSSFTCMPTGQLENIVEDSETYLSSSQQHSSNLNASGSTRDLQDKQHYLDTQKESNANTVQPRVEYPTLYKNMSEDLDGQTNQQKHVKNVTLHAQREAESIKRKIQVIPQQLAERYKNNQIGNSTTIRKEEPISETRKQTPSLKQNHINIISDKCHVDVKKYNENTKPSICSRYEDNRKLSLCVDDSLILSGEDLRVDERHVTPERSVHVDMQEYSSDDDSDRVKRTSKVGWTFYNNVLGQVNQILQNSCTMDMEQREQKLPHNMECEDSERKTILDTVKVTTLEHLRKLGISLSDAESRETTGNKKDKGELDASFYPRLDYQANMTHAASAISESNTSMHMKALALKYLNDEQLADLAIQKQGGASMKQFMLSNVQGTNMSFATMRYLERYQLLPGRNNVQNSGNSAQEAVSKLDADIINAKQADVVQQHPFSHASRTSYPSKILDISTLKQQPKLL